MATGMDASEIEVFALGLGRVVSEVALAVQAELIRVGTDAKVRVNQSHEKPYLTGRLRRSVDIDVGPGDISLWSSVIYSRIWEYGGEVSPNGVVISFPKSEFVGKEILGAGEGVDERIGAQVETIFELLP